MTEAETYKWELLSVPAGSDLILETGYYREKDILGLNVVGMDDEPLGRIDEVVKSPAHDIARIGTALVPMVKEFFVEINVPEGWARIRTIPGLLDLDKAEECS